MHKGNYNLSHSFLINHYKYIDFRKLTSLIYIFILLFKILDNLFWFLIR